MSVSPWNDLATSNMVRMGKGRVFDSHPSFSDSSLKSDCCLRFGDILFLVQSSADLLLKAHAL